jgi:hypothetical protein
VLVDAMTGVLPIVPWVLPLLVLFLAVIVAVAARAVRGWVTERRHDTSLDALRVARLLALAKAAEYFGAVLAGGYLGLGIRALADLAVPMGQNRALLSALVIVAAIILTVAAVRLERACRVPPPDEEPPSDSKPSD